MDGGVFRMAGGVFRGTAVEDIKAGADVEVTISGQQVLVALSRRPTAVQAPQCWKGSQFARACLGQRMWQVERPPLSGWACSAHLAWLVQELQKADGGGDAVVRPAGLAS